MNRPDSSPSFPIPGDSPRSEIKKRPEVSVWEGLPFAVTFVILSSIVAVALVAWLGSDHGIDHTSNWKSYRNGQVSQWFRLPPETKVVSAKEKLPWPMGQEVTITFRLPETKTPEEWVKKIANDSGITDRFRETPLRYNGEADYHIIEYDPEKQVYTAMFGWD